LIEGEPPAGAFTLSDVAGVGVVTALIEDARCERCWQLLPDVGTDATHPDTCARCADAVSHLEAAAAE
jgi:isoleucyl-tRNA synthetase